VSQAVTLSDRQVGAARLDVYFAKNTTGTSPESKTCSETFGTIAAAEA